MTAVRSPRQSPAAKPTALGDAVNPAAAGGAPVIVLTYAHSGAERLWQLLDAHPALACTSATGILPLCEQAAATWRKTDGHASPGPSRLAATSTRALTTSIITTILARLGKRRWCEFATAPPSAAETFLQLYPGTRFLCLHRACADVIYDALHTSLWGMAGPELAPFTTAYPGSAVASLTAYWTAHTEPLITFEESHPDVCLRVRYEDLRESPDADDLFAFLGLQAPLPTITAPASPGDTSLAPCDAHRRVPFPTEQVPAPLLARAHGLLKKLGYPPLGTGEHNGRS